MGGWGQDQSTIGNSRGRGILPSVPHTGEADLLSQQRGHRDIHPGAITGYKILSQQSGRRIAIRSSESKTKLGERGGAGWDLLCPWFSSFWAAFHSSFCNFTKVLFLQGLFYHYVNSSFISREVFWNWIFRYLFWTIISCLFLGGPQ